MYLFLVSILIYILVCGYVMLFSGSVFFEGIVKGWYRSNALAEDNYALWWSFLTVFPCLLGVIGGIAVLTTQVDRFHNVKILLFVPAVVWTTELVLINFRWGLLYWVQWLYLVPLMLLAIFVLYGVIKQVHIPILPKKAVE